MPEVFLAALIIAGSVVTVANVFVLAALKRTQPSLLASIGSPHWAYFIMGSWISFGPYVRALFARREVYDRFKDGKVRFGVVVIWVFFPLMVVAWVALITTIVVT